MQVAGFKSDEYEMSLPEIGKALGMSTSRVYEIQVSAMSKVRMYCEMHGIVFEDFVDSLSATRREKNESKITNNRLAQGWCIPLG
jgi:hypothetical protein